jgi:hypothetical protein
VPRCQLFELENSKDLGSKGVKMTPQVVHKVLRFLKLSKVLLACFSMEAVFSCPFTW